MNTLPHKLLCALVLTSFYATSGSASPLKSQLLPLVPPGAAIVSGFENYPDPHHHGQLLLSTHNNRVDLADWLSIIGVDNTRILNEGIEVAATPGTDGLLTEHLLLMAGHFDQERVFDSVEKNGARRSHYEDRTIMVIQPFEREKGEMQDARWLVILENRIGMLGTQAIVQEALHRFATHAEADSQLRERLSQLRSDVSSWNVLVSPPNTRKNIFLHQGSRWEDLVDDAEVLLVGARFGPKIRVDFSLHASAQRGVKFFSQKASSFAAVFASVLPSDSKATNPAKVLSEPNRVQGSIQLSSKQFAMWGEQTKAIQDWPPQAMRAPSRGE